MSDQPVAIVTGSSRGIGRAIASKLASIGHAVTINYNSSREAAEVAVQAIEAQGGNAIAVKGNVGNREDRQRMIAETLAQFGRLDVLVNNAGITSPGRLDLLDATEENWDLVLDTNLKGPFFLAQLAAREMVKQIGDEQISRATIINVSSISAYAASTNRVDYCIAKSGMQMMTWLLADRLAEEKILVYEICPGVIESDMTTPVKAKYDKLIADGLSPIHRWGKPEDVANVVAALLSDAFSFCTGERINVDGGFHIRRL
jgi:3-oxoacyl-[acyl-carrier protein] reductase